MMILRRMSDEKCRLFLANCGDVEAMLTKNGRVEVLTVRHRAIDNREEATRVMNTEGIITEDGKVSDY